MNARHARRANPVDNRRRATARPNDAVAASEPASQASLAVGGVPQVVAVDGQRGNTRRPGQRGCTPTAALPPWRCE